MAFCDVIEYRCTLVQRYAGTTFFRENLIAAPSKAEQPLRLSLLQVTTRSGYETCMRRGRQCSRTEDEGSGLSVDSFAVDPVYLCQPEQCSHWLALQQQG